MNVSVVFPISGYNALLGRHNHELKPEMIKQLLAVLIFCFSTNLFAQGPPVTTETPVMLGVEGSGIRTFGKFIAKENTNIYIQPLGIPYNITSKFQVGGVFLFKLVNPKGMEAKGGFSDMTLFTKYQIYKKDGTAKTFRILANIKQTFPTGKTTSTPKLGAGIYQTYMGLIIGKITTQLGLYGDIGYNVTGDNATDNFVYNFSVSIPLLPQKYPPNQLNTLVELNGNYLIGPDIHMLYISPGIQFIPGRRILFESSIQLPIIQSNNATDKTKFMVLLGTRFLIN